MLWMKKRTVLVSFTNINGTAAMDIARGVEWGQGISGDVHGLRKIVPY